MQSKETNEPQSDTTDSDEPMDSEALGASLSHDIRNKFSAIHHAAFDLKRRVAKSDLWTSDPRIEGIFGLIDNALDQADELLETRLPVLLASIAKANCEEPPQPAHPTNPATSTEQNTPKIFLADDDESNRVTLAALLEMDGFEVDTADSFASALSALQSNSDYAAVILDYNLGDGTALDLIDHVRQGLPDAKLIILSGSGYDEELAANVDALMQKGGASEQILQDILDLLGT